MRGDQLARQWRVTRAIEARPNGLTMAEIAACDGHKESYRCKALQKPVPKAGMGFFVIGARSQWYLGYFLKVARPDKRRE
jgi:hypothetical protein